MTAGYGAAHAEAAARVSPRFEDGRLFALVFVLLPLYLGHAILGRFRQRNAPPQFKVRSSRRRGRRPASLATRRSPMRADVLTRAPFDRARLSRALSGTQLIAIHE